MTFEAPLAATEAFVWIWLPGALEPVIAARIEREAGAQ
jgi:serine/threonine-protein kinase HipA